LGIKTPVIDKNDIGIITNGNQLQIKSKEQNIEAVIIYDLLGRIVYQKDNINNIDFSTGELGIHNQAVIVKVKTDDNMELVKKVIVK
jgi:hypothetical protein